MNFKEQVQSMTAKQIIMAMVESLTPPPTVNVDMNSFGHIIEEEGQEPRCYGCAATNTICKITGIKPIDLLKSRDTYASRYGSRTNRANALDADFNFLANFENAIDDLRRGKVSWYNQWAEVGKFAVIKLPENLELPALGNDYTVAELDIYRQLADAQD